MCKAHAVVVCFDLTQRATYDNAASWVAAAKPALSRGAVLFFLGTKSDCEMFAGAREFSRSLALLHSAAGSAFVSAKSGTGIADAFQTIAAGAEAAAPAGTGGKAKPACVVS